MSKSVVKSLTLQGALVAALGTAGLGGTLSEDPKVQARIDKIVSAAGLLLVTFGRLRKKDLHVKKPVPTVTPIVPLFVLALLVLAGCTSTLDRAAAQQNLSNVRQITAENAEFWAASGKPASLVKSASDRNQAAVDLASKIAGE